MSRNAFQELLKRYLEGKCSDEEKAVIEKWYNLLDEGDIKELSEAEVAEILDTRVWNLISEKIDTEAAVIPIQRRRYLWPALAAACLAGILVAGYVIHVPALQPDFLSGVQEVVTTRNTTQEPMPVALSDGSLITLRPGATLRFPARFTAARREVFLTGEGFFEITPDKARPFFVFSGNLITRVVGTSFHVRSNDPSHAGNEVAVVTGKVVVTKNEGHRFYEDLLQTGDAGVVELIPNQRAIYSKESSEMLVTLVEHPVPVETAQAQIAPVSFIFNNSPLAAVLTILEKTYGIAIDTGQPLDACTFTGDLSDQDLYTQLDFICQSVGATYQIEGTRILVRGGDCR